MYRESIPKLEMKINRKNHVKISFNGGQISSDGGLILLKKFDKNIGFMDSINKLITDPRVLNRITHEQKELLSQRLYQIIAGYEDANDASLLRNDPIFKLIADKKDLHNPLGSQPTISRLENRISFRQIRCLKENLLEQYIRWIKPNNKKPLILDIDSSEDPTHGEQQLTFFNGLFDKTCYHPLFIFEANSQALLSARLRPGNQYPSRNGHRILAPVIKRLRNKWPKKRIIIRGDSSFGSKRMHDFCRAKKCDYIFAVGNKSSRFNKNIEQLLVKAQKKYEKTHKNVSLYSSFWYNSRKWKPSIRVRVHIRVTSQELTKKFIITSLKGSTQHLFELYNQRGQCENYIKELKLGHFADRLSCHTFKANSFRLMLHCLAYQLIVLFKRILHITDLAKAQIDTLRLNLFKIGAIVSQKARWSWINLSSSWPFKTTFLKVAKTLCYSLSLPDG